MLLIPLAAGRHLSGEVPLTLLAKAAIPAELIAYTILIVVTKAVLDARGHHRMFATIGWKWPSIRTALPLMLLAVVTAIAVLYAGSLFHVPPDLPIEQMMKDPFVANLFLVFGILPAPFFEEFYFRGLLYPALQRRVGVVVSVVITAAAFAAIHASQLAGSLAPVALLFVVGVILTIIRVATGSVAASFLFHAAYNATLFLIGALAK
jgi:membrane protease YdiL (CAAX protease family)